MIQDPGIITTDAAGNGSLRFVDTRPEYRRQLQRVGVECPSQSSGIVSLYRNGHLLSSTSLAQNVSASGDLPCYPGDVVELRVTGGPVSTILKVTFSYELIPGGASEPAPAASLLTFDQPVGFVAPVDDPRVLWSNTNEVIAAFGIVTSPITDVRAYNSISLRTKFHDGTAIAGDVFQVIVTFYADAAGAQEVWVETYEQYTVTGGGAGTIAPVLYIDTVRAAYVKVQLYDPSSTGRTTQVDYRLIGSFRIVPSVFLAQLGDATGRLLIGTAVALGAGASATVYARIWRGPAKLYILSAVGGGAASAQIMYGSNIQTSETPLAVAAAATAGEKMVTTPASQARVIITNNAAGAQTIRVALTGQFAPV